MEAHRGLDGISTDDSGHDVSHQFREDGEFLIRQKLPGSLAKDPAKRPASAPWPKPCTGGCSGRMAASDCAHDSA
jgi:hypothetical protein